MSAFRNFIASRTGFVVCLLLAGVGAYLLVTHTGHIVTALPYLILIACPLMHFLSHGHKHARHRDNPR